MNESQTERGYRISEGLMIGAFTLYSYIVAYSYEEGFCDYWNIPRYLIEISLVNVLSAGLAVLSFIFMIAMTVNSAALFVHKELDREMDTRKFFVVYHLVVLAGLTAILLGHGFASKFFILVAAVAIGDFFCYVLPWRVDKQFHPEPASFFDRVGRNLRSDDIKSGLDYLIDRVGFRNWVLFLMVWLLTTLGASSAGRFAAKSSKTYSIVETENLVVLKRYGDTFILRPINSDKVLVTNELLLWSQQELTNKSIKTMKLGKLRLTEEAKEKDDN